MRGFPRPPADSVFGRVSRSVGVLAANGVALYGVLALGWNTAAVVFLFVAEGVVRVAEDFLRIRIARKERVTDPGLWFFEVVFTLFFGFFALLVYGPYESLTEAIEDGFARFGALAVEVRYAILALALARAWHLGRDLWADGWIGRRPRRPLSLHAGAHAFLLFCAVMMAPLVARTGPNPMGGLAALVGLKSAGELVVVWLPQPGGRRRRARPDPQAAPGP